MTKDLSWWQSDEARPARLAKYVSHLLFSCGARNQLFSDEPPSWPAVFHYDNASDLPYWVEVKVRTHARDYLTGCHPDHINEAARLLAA